MRQGRMGVLGPNRFLDAACLALCAAMTFVVMACAGSMKNSGIPDGRQPVSSFGWVDFYQGPLNHLSAVRYGECPMYPSCSSYCRLAMEKHGFAVGWMMSVDRLIRCGRDEPGVSPPIYVSGKFKTHDPVENNDFWW